MEIKINQSDLRKVNKLFNKLEDISEREAGRIIDNNGLKIAREIKQPPIPVDTGNLRNNVVYNANKKRLESNAPYSGFVEYGTKAYTVTVKNAKVLTDGVSFFGKQVNIPARKGVSFFFSKINIGLKRLSLDLNNAILRSMK